MLPNNSSSDEVVCSWAAAGASCYNSVAFRTVVEANTVECDPRPAADAKQVGWGKSLGEPE